MSIIEPMITKYGGIFIASLVVDAATISCEYIYDQDDGIYATILAKMLQRKEKEELSLIDELKTCVEIIPDWDLAKYDKILIDKEVELELELTQEDISEIIGAKVYCKTPFAQKTANQGEL